MNESLNFRLRFLQQRLTGIAGELTRVRFPAAPLDPAWQPAINVYRCRKTIVIAADLSGVPRSEVELSVEPRRVRLRGRRLPPEPGEAEEPVLQVLALEIDHGTFHRDILLPVAVQPEGMETEQREGFLWIRLPLAREP